MHLVSVQPPHRRSFQRIPIRLFIEQSRGQEHWIGLSYNLSAGGVYLCQRPQPIPNEMGLELELPGLGDSIWTKAEVRFVGDQGKFMGVGLAFTAMANKHREVLQDWVRETSAQVQPNDRRASIRRLAA